MTMRFARVSVAGVSPLLTNNPQMVDRFNPFAKRMAAINAKKTRRTDDDYMELRNIEVEAKAYFDDEMGVYVPSSWLTEAIAVNAFRVAKISRDGVRSAVFAKSDKIALNFADSDKVKTVADIVRNPRFVHVMAIPQGQVRVVKAWPIFHGWSFNAELEFDDKIIDLDSLTRIAEHAGSYGGFGDFRPRFGRARVEVHGG